jgi:hypothetical protein
MWKVMSKKMPTRPAVPRELFRGPQRRPFELADEGKRDRRDKDDVGNRNDREN